MAIEADFASEYFIRAHDFESISWRQFGVLLNGLMAMPESRSARVLNPRKSNT